MKAKHRDQRVRQLHRDGYLTAEQFGATLNPPLKNYQIIERCITGRLDYQKYGGVYGIKPDSKIRE